jgi:hypothetical protein
MRFTCSISFLPDRMGFPAEPRQPAETPQPASVSSDSSGVTWGAKVSQGYFKPIIFFKFMPGCSRVWFRTSANVQNSNFARRRGFRARRGARTHKQLRKDAPHRPHVDLRPVLVRPKEQLGRPVAASACRRQPFWEFLTADQNVQTRGHAHGIRGGQQYDVRIKKTWRAKSISTYGSYVPIPQGNNTVCECIGVLLGPGTCEPKVGQLQHALVVYQKVRPLRRNTTPQSPGLPSQCICDLPPAYEIEAVIN